MIVEWEQISENSRIPLLGDELSAHIENYHGRAMYSSCSAWNLLYRVLLNNDIQPPAVSFSATGKPYFVDNHLHFSISHSRGLCAVAISDCPVGVDIEWHRSDYDPHLLERSMCADEKSVFDGDFTRIWCRKEAIAKMTGEGINSYPVNINTTLYHFREQEIEFKGRRFWLVAVEDRLVEVR